MNVAKPDRIGLECSIDQVDGIRVLRVGGEVDLSNSTAFAHLIQTALAEGNATVIDLTAITYMDTKGIRVLEMVASNPGKPTLRLSPLVRKLLEVLQMEDKFKVAVDGETYPVE